MCVCVYVCCMYWWQAKDLEMFSGDEDEQVPPCIVLTHSVKADPWGLIVIWRVQGESNEAMTVFELVWQEFERKIDEDNYWFLG